MQPRLPAQPPIDCFYVYPTVSDEPTGNSDLAIGLPQVLVAQTQAAPFSQVCKVYAPDVPADHEPRPDDAVAPREPAPGLRRRARAPGATTSRTGNHGRGVVLIGHSQGAYVLKHLVSTVIDRSAAQRRLLVSAILLGGQVHAANTPAARAPTSPTSRRAPRAAATGCVIAYSSFDRVPPPGARFGRSRISRHPHHLRQPGGARSPGGRARRPRSSRRRSSASPERRSTRRRRGSRSPGLYTARCEQSGNASWLQITRHERPRRHPAGGRPDARARVGPALVDVNIALTDLVAVVPEQSQAFARSEPRHTPGTHAEPPHAVSVWLRLARGYPRV